MGRYAVGPYLTTWKSHVVLQFGLCFELQCFGLVTKQSAKEFSAWVLWNSVNELDSTDLLIRNLVVGDML